MNRTDDTHAPLRDDVRLLGGLLGETLREQAGADLLETVERVRGLSKRGRAGDEAAFDELTEVLSSMPVRHALPVTRAFSLFLNLANIAEQHHRIRRRRDHARIADAPPQRASCEDVFARLLADGVTPDRLHAAVCALEIELVFTAHPTEVMRRTLVRKYQRIASQLERRDRTDLTVPEREQLHEDLRREVHSIWETDEIRHRKPTPAEEARRGYVVIEQTVWRAVPRFLRELDRALREATGRGLPVNAVPVRFGSWMGGDRDGNPNVTPAVTEEVCLLARWMAADLLHAEIDELRSELSMHEATRELRSRVGTVREPYRELLRGVRDRLRDTRLHIEARLDGREPDDRTIYEDARESNEALQLCHRSLVGTGEDLIAGGRLTDVMRQVACFGVSLVRIDLRQDAARHVEAMDTITTALGLGSYAAWPEAERVAFLLKELESRRPLAPTDLEMSDSVRDVLETFRVAADQPADSLGAYVISMARHPSDVLVVELLQREAGVRPPLRVVPLFETVDDLRGAGESLEALLALPWYRERIGDRQEIMIGYSDSAKDGGRLAAAWELFRAQERVVEACSRHGILPTLFHGRGGTVGRGGGPIYLAIRSQPPGSIQGRLRVTEQGEMIQAKFGLEGIAMRTLELYATATLESTIRPAASIPGEWRETMTELAEVSRGVYRSFVEDDRFIRYFRAVTPVDELDGLNIGSRPARRKGGGGLDSLRAIPWIFAWTQMRMMVPSWLGVGDALGGGLEKGQGDLLRTMYREWPFFRSTLDLIEMVLAKAEPRIAACYDARLVPDELRSFGEELRRRHARTVEALLEVTGHETLLAENPVLRRSIDVRNPYVDPINLVQVELLRRLRASQDDPLLGDALLSSINGIAAGIRNSG